jgi:aminoglycoside phosphotransferase (APT) family kinase protein
MTTPADQETFGRIVRRIDPQSRLRSSWPLTGGVSAQVTALELAHPDGQITKLIVRQHGEVDLKQNPHIARDEFRLLQIALSHGLPVPAPVFVDESREILGTPFIVMEFVEGEPEFSPPDLPGYLGELALYLARIHHVAFSPELAFLPRRDKGFGTRPENLDHSLNEEGIRDALEAVWPIAALNSPVLLHGDYWPGNILRTYGMLSAVIDWEDAATGDPLADLGNSRLEILWAFGVDAMDAFTNHYRSLADVNVTHLPYWDLCAALRPCSKLPGWGLDDVTEKRMRERHAQFVDRALEHLTPLDTKSSGCSGRGR